MKKNNSLLITILSGAIFCFVCLGMVLLFPGNTRSLKSEESPLPNAGEHGYVEDEEISLGDIDHCDTEETTESCSCSSGTHIGSYCYTGKWSSSPTSSDCTSEGGYYVGGNCYSGRSTHKCTTTTACTQCEDGYSLSSGSCTADPVITCKNPTYTGSSQTIATCSNGSITNNGTATEVGTYTVSCQGNKQVSKNCSIVAATNPEPDPDPVITCTNPEYTGSSQVIATCSNGSITNNGTATEVGSYTVSCQGSKLVTKSCAISPKALEPVITCLNPRYTGGSQTIATCENGTITSGGTATDIGNNHVVSCQGSKLVSKSCSILGNEGTVCCCTSDKFMCSWKKSCTASQPLALSGVNTEMACKSVETLTDDCTIGVSIRSKATSITTDGENDINSYYTVTVSIRGKNCGGKTATYTATNGRPSPSSYTVPTGSVSSTVSFNVYPSDPCKDSCATASINGKSATACLGSDDSIRTDWQPKENVCEKNPQYTTFYLADEAGANIYYSNYDESKGCYTTQWKRYLCGRSGTPPTPTTPEAPHCYVDNDGEYHWSIYTESSWKIVDTITKEENCKKDETPACYISPSGEYVWGKHGKDDGYVLITSITDSSACKTPTPEEACYKKDNDYKWTSTQPEGYTKVETAKTPAECAPAENPACYLHGNSFVWGKYAKVSGYIFVENIEEEQYCKTPDVDACYVDSKGDYVWGKYGSTEGYTLVPSVTEMSQCKNNVPVPKTGISISKIIYIFMAILMAFGVGFIYYSSAVKKND